MHGYKCNVRWDICYRFAEIRNLLFSTMEKHDNIFVVLSVGFLICFTYGMGENISFGMPKICPLNWIKRNDSCYLTGDRFHGQTWYSASAFCRAFDAHLVEINDKYELEFIDRLAKQVDWVDGPWVGMLRPFGDEFWILPSIRTQTQDLELNKMFGEIAKGSSHDCAGYDSRGKNFGFWRCRNGGSPWCELDLPADRPLNN